MAEVYGGPFTSRPSIFLHIEQGFKTNPEGTAVIVAHQAHTHLSELVPAGDGTDQQDASGDTPYLSWTYSQLHRAALKLALGMLACGVQSGQTIVTLIPNGLEIMLLFYTAAILKITIAPLDVGALTTPRREELVNLMRNLKPDVLVVPTAADSEAVDTAVQTSGISQPVLKLRLDEQAEENNWTHISSVSRRVPSNRTDEQALLDSARVDDPERVGLIMFTSGTSSGKPKGCPRQVGGLCQFYDAQSWSATFGRTTRFLSASANFRVIAPSIWACVWKVGGTVVMPGPAFSPGPVLDSIRQHSVTDMLMVPAQVHALVEHPTFKNSNVDTMRSIMTGGDMITRDLLTKISDSFPKAEVSVGHGMTEGGGLFTWVWYGTPLSEVPYHGEIAPLGRVAEGARLRIWDREKGRVAKKSEAGELHVCCNVTIRHYLNEEHEDSFYEDDLGRWFNTGDSGLISTDDVVYILGRIKDVIKRGGVPITPAALESSIGKFTGASTSVIGIPSPTLGQEAFAVLQDFGGKSKAQVKQCVIDLFGKDYQLVGAVSLEQLALQGFPLNATGKVMKIKLQQIVGDHLSRQK